MGNSIKQWHKSVLLCSVVVVLLGGAAWGQVDYIDGPCHVLVKFTSTADSMLSGIGFWTAEAWDGFGVSVYGAFDPLTGGSNELATAGGDLPTAGYHEISLNTPVSLSDGQTYYVRLRSYDRVYAADLDPLNAAVGTSYFTTQPDATQWLDLFDNYDHASLSLWPSGDDVPGASSFLINPLLSSPPGIVATGMHGDWEITDQQFVQGVFDTLDVDKTANELKPFVMEVDVTGELDPIAVTEIVTNNTGEDWIGYGFQLGFWDDVEERFVPATVGDGLAFIQGYNNSNEFGAPTTFSPNSIYFDGALIPDGGTATFNLMVDLPGDPQFTFALRQYAIPEPGTAMLLGIAGLMLLGFRRRR